MIYQLSPKSSASHFRKIALIQKKSIKNGFLSSLSIRFIALLYKAICESGYGGIFIANIKGDEIAGFACFTIDTKKMYARVLLRNAPKFFIVLLPQLIKRSFIVKVIETLCYPYNRAGSKITKSRAELLSIAVSGKLRKKGIGQQLVKVMEAAMSENKVEQYDVVTNKNNSASNGFYLAQGFTCISTFLHHRIKMNRYTKKIQTSEGKS
jgi:ribosomal protein S18 acetylase RimI-like enzyme